MAIRRTARWIWAAAVAMLPAVVAAQASHVSLSIDERGVTLEARDATLREILAEWSRVGGTKVRNAEALDAKPVTLSLAGVSEREALDILLRDIGGYLLSARGAGDHTVSQFAGLLVVPARTASPAAPSTPTPVRTFAAPGRLAPPPVVADEPLVEQEQAGDGDTDEPRPRRFVPKPVNGVAPGPGVRIGGGTSMSAPTAMPAEAPGTFSGSGTASGSGAPSPFGRVNGVARPGEIVQAPPALPGGQTERPQPNGPSPQP